MNEKTTDWDENVFKNMNYSYLHTVYVQATLWQFFKKKFINYFFVGPFLIMITILKTKKIMNKNMNGATKKMSA